MSKEERLERFYYFLDAYDEFDWWIKDRESNEYIEHLEDITKLLNQQDQENQELKKQLEEAQSNAVKFGFVKAISEFNKLISDINWADEKKIKVNIRKLINKQYEELAKDFRELQGE